jgi:flagellar protein FlaF
MPMPPTSNPDRFAEARTIEYVLLGQISGAMVLADKNPNDRAVLNSVVSYNRNLWDTWLSDLQRRDNRLPTELKRSLSQLAVWVKKETERVLDGRGNCRNLVKVNQLIMAGLAPRDGADAANAGQCAAVTA